MSSIIPSTTDGNCGICLDPFSPSELRFTHKGGEKHEGFHKNCLIPWLEKNSICPIDRAPIDPNTFYSLKDRIQRKVQSGLKMATAIVGISLILFAYAMAVGTTTVLMAEALRTNGYEDVILSDFYTDTRLF